MSVFANGASYCCEKGVRGHCHWQNLASPTNHYDTAVFLLFTEYVLSAMSYTMKPNRPAKDYPVQ